MDHTVLRIGRWVFALAALLLAQLACAQATRTWVSGVGDDANPCSRTAPCKTLAGAISKTADGGEIDALDPGGFGTLTITKAITIDGGGTMASILSSGTNGINVAAGASDVVTIRNISIQGAGTGLAGIRFLSGKELHIENCVIQNVLQKGIDAQPTTTNALLHVKDTVIRGASDATNGGGIFIKPNGAGVTMSAVLEQVSLSGNKFGVRIEDNTKAVIRKSVASNSAPGNGFFAFSAGLPSELVIEDSIASNNAIAGVRAQGSAAIARISNVTISNNGSIGLSTSDGGQIISFGNNRNSNAVPGSPTSTVPQQ